MDPKKVEVLVKEVQNYCSKWFILFLIDNLYYHIK